MAGENLMNFLVLRNGRADYDHDFYGWTVEQAELLRARRFNELDLRNIVEEIESLGKREKIGLSSSLKVVLVHLLKLKYQPLKAKTGWRGSVEEHRDRISRAIEQSPSLASYPAQVLAAEYARARRKAAIETGFEEVTFPVDCPFTIQQVLDDEFWPGA